MESGIPGHEADRPWTIVPGSGPLVATAIHDGHWMRPELVPFCALGAEERRREEDPWTGAWTGIAGGRVVVHRSRFEVDMNRPREGCVYRTPEEAWGLRVWRAPLSENMLERSRALHDAFYTEMRALLDAVAAEHERFVLLDLHSYNHRRGGPSAPPDDPAANPDVNLGTGSLDHARWSPAANAFVQAMARESVGGRALDVRENVRFRGGWFSTWVNQTYAGRGCALAIEVKKIFMDEWTGAVDRDRHEQIGAALGRAAAAVLTAVERSAAAPSVLAAAESARGEPR